MMKLTALVIALSTASLSISGELNPRPLIGIMSQPLYKGSDQSYIAASYVQYVEMAGARAVPIVYTHPMEEIERRFRAINGLILPGGSVGLDVSQAKLYHDVTKHLFHLAHESNKKGDPFAVHGVCMGFQMMMQFSSNGTSPLTKHFDAKDHLTSLDLTSHAATSRTVGGAGMEYLRRRISNASDPITYENHNEGITLPTFTADKHLHAMWDVLATNKDRTGKTYISMVEAKDPSIVMSGTQWHPEKNPYEFKSRVIPHTFDSIRLSQHMANVFVGAARRSSHRPASDEDEDRLNIWNHQHAFNSTRVKDFQLIFLFDQQQQDTSALSTADTEPYAL